MRSLKPAQKSGTRYTILTARSWSCVPSIDRKKALDNARKLVTQYLGSSRIS
jgi:hypothetical protein